MFKASVIPISKELIKEANSVLYNFVWNGKDKVKRLALISGIEMGGLKMLDIQFMICAKRVTCLKKLLEDYSSHWKTILDELLLPIGGRFVLHCNFQTSKLKINLPAYYKECFDAWSEVNGKTPSCCEEIINEIIWNNKFLCYDKKIDAQKRYSKPRLREDKGFNIREQLLLVRLLFTYKPRTKIFSYEYYQFDSRRMALTY